MPSAGTTMTQEREVKLVLVRRGVARNDSDLVMAMFLRALRTWPKHEDRTT